MSIINPYIDVCNYEKCYPALWNRHVIFSERGDGDYPYPESESSPPCFTMVGEFKKPDFLLIGNNNLTLSEIERALIFALECTVSGKCVMCFGIGKFSREICLGMNECARAPVVLFKSGFDELFSPAYSWMLYRYCLYGGGFLSPFRPELLNRELEFGSFVEIAALFSPLVFFSMAPYEYSIAQAALDKGSLVYLHYASLSYPLARALAKDGAPVIEHLDSSKGYVYKRRDGTLSFLDFS